MTKTILTLAAAALLGSTTLVAAASNSFYLERVQSFDGVIDFPLVSAEQDGVIEIYGIHGGQTGDLLGTQAVTAGVNTDIKVALTVQPLSDVIAVLKIDGVAVAEQDVELDRSVGGSVGNN